MIKAIIFDCFGVLTTDLWLEFKDKYFANDPVGLQKATDLNKETDEGLIKHEDFIEQVTKLAGVSADEANLLPGRNAPNTALFSYIKEELKPKYKIGMLSNAAGNWLDELFRPEQLELFDAVVLSYEINYIKPHPKIYQAIEQKLGAESRECVFVDDREGYCTAAEDLGMQAIHYRNFEQFRAEIEQILSHA